MCFLKHSKFKEIVLVPRVSKNLFEFWEMQQRMADDWYNLDDRRWDVYKIAEMKHSFYTIFTQIH